MAFADAFDMAYVIKHDLRLIRKSYVPLTTRTDSLPLFALFSKASSTIEKRLNIDLQTVQDLYIKSEVQDVSYIRSEYDNADALAKVEKRSTAVEAIENFLWDHTLQKWIANSF